MNNRVIILNYKRDEKMNIKTKVLMIGYLFCSIFILIFNIFNINVINYFTTFICVISVYKSAIRIKNYKSIDVNRESNYNRNIYKTYRIRIILFWTLFLIICFFAKKILKISPYYFLAGIFFCSR